MPARENDGARSTYTDWRDEVGFRGFTPGTGTEIDGGTYSVTTQSPILTGLNAGVEYDLYTRSDCEPDAAVEWIGPIEFTPAPQCGQAYTDPGGPDADYAAQTDAIRTIICPIGGAPNTIVQVTFEEFDLADGDRLEVRNGSQFAELIGRYGSFPVPTSTLEPPRMSLPNNPGTFTGTKDGCLSFDFYNTGASSTGAGWTATVNCVPRACPAPTNVLAAPANDAVFVDWIGNGARGEYLVEVGAPGFTPGTGNAAQTLATDEDDPTRAIVEGLAASTAYDVYVANDCPNGSLQPTWSSVVSFTTGSNAYVCGDAPHRRRRRQR